MIILLFGVSNVGKSLTGQLLADHLKYHFYDIDDEVKKQLNTSLENFVTTGTLVSRDRVRCDIIINLLKKDSENKVIAVTPLSYMDRLKPFLSSADILAIELTDSAENIFDRLVFSDENDVIYKDDVYKNKHKAHYLKEIREDLDWYGSVYRDIKYHFNIEGCSPDHVVHSLITQFNLKEV